MEERLLEHEKWSEEKRAEMENRIIEAISDDPVEVQALSPTLSKKHKKTSLWNLFIIWFTANIKAGSWACGALATTVYGLDPIGALLSIAIGNILGGIMLGVTAAMGRSGMPQPMFSVPLFGYKGAKIPQFLLYLTILGWTAANTFLSVLLGMGIIQLFYPQAGIGIAILLAVALTVLSVWVANKKFDVVVAILTPVTYAMIVILIIMTIICVRDVNWAGQASEFVRASKFNYVLAFISCVGVLGVGYLGTWSPFGADYGRYVNMERPGGHKGIFWMSFGSGWVVCTWLLGTGALFGYMFGGVDPAVHIVNLMPGFALPALIVVLVGSWSTCVVNYINAGIDMKALGLKWKRTQCTYFTGVVVLIISLYSLVVSDIASILNSFLIALVIWVVPWFVIQAMDWFLVSKGNYPFEGVYGLKRIYPDWESRGLTALVVGFIASAVLCYPGENYLFGVIPLFSPLMPKYFAYGDLSFFTGAVVTAIVYWFTWVKPKTAGLNKFEDDKVTVN
jgi:NCS1 family nucleobase:cation symporter-1